MARAAARPSAGPVGASPEPGPAEGTSTGERVVQVVMAAVLAVVSALLMVTTHRQGVRVAGVALPTGLLLGAAFQLAASLFLLAATGRRLPLVVLAVLWCLVAMPFAGQSGGGSVLMPAELGGAVQPQGWIVQILGVAIPLVVLAVAWARQMRSLSRTSADGRPVRSVGDAR